MTAYIIKIPTSGSVHITCSFLLTLQVRYYAISILKLHKKIITTPILDLIFNTFTPNNNYSSSSAECIKGSLSLYLLPIICVREATGAGEATLLSYTQILNIYPLFILIRHGRKNLIKCLEILRRDSRLNSLAAAGRSISFVIWVREVAATTRVNRSCLI